MHFNDNFSGSLKIEYYNKKEGNMTIRCKSEDFLDVLGSMLPNRLDFLVLVSGPTCSGKSFLAKKAAKFFAGSSLVFGDDYFRDITDPLLPSDGNGWYLFDDPGAYRADRLRNDVCCLLSGGEVFSPQYDIRNNWVVAERCRRVLAGRPVFVEFLFAIMLLSDICDKAIKVYLDTPREICLGRRVERDIKMYPVSEERVKRLFDSKFWPSYQRFAEEQMKKADIIVT
jgi:uridine kinase